MNPLRVSLALLAMLAAPLASAKSSDRQQPMSIDSHTSDGTLTDDGQVKFIGDVRIEQGTLKIQADQAVARMRNGEISKVIVDGTPVRMQQEQDNGDRMSARARRVDYDLSGDTIVLSGDAEVVQPRGSMRGERIVYNVGSGQMNAGSDGGRVRMVIQPKTAQPKTAPPPPAAASDER